MNAAISARPLHMPKLPIDNGEGTGLCHVSWSCPTRSVGNLKESDSEMNKKHVIQQFRRIGLLLMSAGMSQACSTLATDDGGGEGGPSYPAGWTRNGQVVTCQLAESPDPTTGEPGPQEGFTCVAKESIWNQSEPDCLNHGLRTVYLQAMCATTFGGVPSDYLAKPVGGWIGDLDDYPTEDFDAQSFCDVTHSFDETDEIPTATDMIPLSTGQYDRCDRESYCLTLAAIISEFPTDGIEPDPWCNVSPGGESEDPAPWRCVGSSSDACGLAELPEYYPSDGPICPIVTPGGKDYCVIASSELEASTKCDDVCDKADTAYLETYGAGYTETLHCDVFGDETMLWVSDVLDECYNVDYEISAAAEPFIFDSDLMIDGGANASSSSNLGFIDYRVDNCVWPLCDITIDGLELSHALYSGTFYDDEENPYPYSVNGISIHLVEPVSGTVTSFFSSPPVVAFPSDLFEMRLSTGDVEVDSTSLGAIGPLSMPINQVTGFYSGGVLTLDITYETVDATMVLTLTTF